MAALKAIPQNHFQNSFEGWTRRWHRCIASQWEYFEGDHGGIQQWGIQHFYRDEFSNFIVRPHMCMIKHGYSIKVETCWGLRIESVFLFLEHGSHSQNPTSRSLPSFEAGHVPQTLARNTVNSRDLTAWQHLSSFRQY